MALIATIVYFFDWENGVYIPIRIRLGGVTYESAPGETFLKFEAQPGVYTIEMLVPGYTFQYWGTWPEYEDAVLFGDIYANPTSITISAFSNIYCIVIPEVVQTPEFIETYRDVDIYWLDWLNIFRAEVAVGYVTTGLTLPEIRASIDSILEFLEPPEEPPEGLFAQVVAAIKIWILENIQPWLQQWGQVVENFITNVTEYVTNVYNTVNEYVTNVVNNITEAITNVYNDLRQYVSNIYNYVTENITNVYNTVNEYVSNVTNVFNEYVTNNLYETTQYITNVIGVLDPLGFLKDPMGYITGAWNLLIDPWAHGIIKAFWEGLEEGLAE